MDKQILTLAAKMLSDAASEFANHGCNDLDDETLGLMDDKEKLLKQYNDNEENEEERFISIEDCSDWVLMQFLSEKLEEFADSL